MSPAQPEQRDEVGPSAPPPPDPHETLLKLRRRVAALPELPMWRACVVDVLEGSSPAVAAFILDQLVRGTVTGDPSSRQVYLGMCSWFFQREDADKEAWYDWARSVYEIAHEEARAYVGFLLMDLPPLRSVGNRNALRQPRFERDVSLGERKSLARGSSRELLGNLLLDIDPQVIRKLLINPQIQVDDVLAIATRRPTVPEVLFELVLSDRWIGRYEVQHALAYNPFGRTDVALKLLPFLHGTDLRAVSYAGDLHHAIPSAALELMALRATRHIKPV